MKGKSTAVTHDENDYFTKNNGIFSVFFWIFLRKNLEKYQKNSVIFFQLRKMEKKPHTKTHTHNNNTTWIHFLENTMSNYRSAKTRNKKKSPNTFLFKKITTFFLLRNPLWFKDL